MSIQQLKDERGIAMALALMVILVLTLMASGLMYSVVNEKTITANHVRDAQALAISKAGTAEAMRRIAYGYVASNDTSIIQDQSSAGGLTPNWICLIFLDNPSSTGNGTNIVYKRGLQTTDILEYSSDYADFNTTHDTTQVLQVRYKTEDVNHNGTIDGEAEMYFYDYVQKRLTLNRTGTTPMDAYPVWEIISPARLGNANRTLITDVVIPRFNALARAALSADGRVDGGGTGMICGHNHPYTTPWGTQPPNCFDPWHLTTSSAAAHAMPPDYSNPGFSPNNNCTSVGCLPGCETMDTVDYNYRKDQIRGNPDYIMHSPRHVQELWEMMGYSSRDELINSLDWTTDDPVTGLSHFTSGYAFHGGTHEGVCWVEGGDLRTNGNFKFKGLMYADGEWRANGTMWILGGVVVKGTIHVVGFTGTMDLLYSSEAISRAIQKAIGSGVLIWSQREMN